MTERLYRPDEVARELRVSLSLVYLMIKRREITAVRVHRQLRIPAEELHRVVTKGIRYMVQD